MRLAWGIVVATCLGLPAMGAVFQQQESSAPANTAGQPPASETAQNEPAAEQGKGAPAAAPAATRTDSKMEPKQAKSGSQPKPVPQQSAPKNDPMKKVDVVPAGTTVKQPAGKLAPATATMTPRKVVVREGGVDEPTAQIVTGMPTEEANRRRRETEQLLKSTEETLRRTDPLTFDAQQQETVSQIHNYMDRASSALKEGDIVRAHTLAVKAGILADDLERR